MYKNYRGNASQFFIAGELWRRGYSAVITLGNTPKTDILCSNLKVTKFVHIQVKTFVPINKTCYRWMRETLFQIKNTKRWEKRFLVYEWNAYYL